MKTQTYEEYWSLSNAFTDYNGDHFLSTLNTCIYFIDKHKDKQYSPNKYQDLQSELYNISNKGEISIRKSINQLVKLGFISTHLSDYHPIAKDYIKASSKKRKVLLSKIVYSNSSLNRSVTKESNLHQINFLIKTLIEKGHLTKVEIIALMLVDIIKYENGFLTHLELSNYVVKAEESGFINRKYNQISYLYNLLNKLDGLLFVNDVLYFKEDAIRIFGDDLTANETKKRDPYLHHLYKEQLKEESQISVNTIQCMVENLSYPVLIASHIKPFSQSNEEEAYDANNGFLLSKNIDSLFDLGYITFDNTGKIIASESLDNDVKTHLSNYRLNSVFLNNNRIEYLEYHRNNVFKSL